MRKKKYPAKRPSRYTSYKATQNVASIVEIPSLLAIK